MARVTETVIDNGPVVVTKEALEALDSKLMLLVDEDEKSLSGNQCQGTSGLTYFVDSVDFESRSFRSPEELLRHAGTSNFGALTVLATLPKAECRCR